MGGWVGAAFLVTVCKRSYLTVATLLCEALEGEFSSLTCTAYATKVLYLQRGNN